MSSMRRRAAETATPGFTIIELMVSILVISILVGITIPVLSSSRRTMLRAGCVSNCGQLAVFLQSYATDYRDSFPSWFPEPTTPGLSVPFSYQSFYLMAYRKWSDYTGIPFRDGIMHCPGNPHGKWTGGIESGIIEYTFSSCLWLTPAYLNPELPPSVWSTMISGRVQRLSSVQFPSSKVGVFEFYVMHGKVADLTLKHADFGPFIFATSAEHGSAAFLDGHALLPDPNDALPDVRGRPPKGQLYNVTEWGIYGRDF